MRFASDFSWQWNSVAPGGRSRSNSNPIDFALGCQSSCTSSMSVRVAVPVRSRFISQQSTVGQSSACKFVKFYGIRTRMCCANATIGIRLTNSEMNTGKLGKQITSRMNIEWPEWAWGYYSQYQESCGGARVFGPVVRMRSLNANRAKLSLR